ncbi:TPA: MFS transporter [Klebsiella variicola subsp. variicola]|nr:MFS transporter [Klebsiella variicola subsp. variicola]HCI6297413.1 MFS transporter [Klebsiella variicola subsp. variicola]
MKTSTEASPSWRVWLALISLSVGSFASVMTEFLPVGILPEVIGDFGITAGQAGFMMTLPGLLAAFSAPFALMASGRTDRKFTLICLSLLLLVSILMAAWAPSYPVLLFSRALSGISLGAFWATAFVVAGHLVGSGNARTGVAMVFAGVTAAMILGVPLGTYMASLFSWRIAFLATAAIAAVSLLLQIAYLPRISPDQPLKVAALLAFARNPAAHKSLALIVLIFVTHFGTYTYLTPLLNQAGLHDGLLTTTLFSFGIAGFIANFVASATIHRHLIATLAGVLLLFIVSLAALVTLDRVYALFLAVTGWGIAWGALPLCLNIFNRQADESRVEASSAMFIFTGQLSIAAGSAAGGVVVDSLGTRADLVSGGVLLVLSLLLLWFWRLGRKPHARECTDAAL